MLLKHFRFPGNDLLSLTSSFRNAPQRATVIVRKFKKDIQIRILDTWRVGIAAIFLATVLINDFLLNFQYWIGEGL